MGKTETLTLAKLADGAIEEMFQRDLAKVLENIADESTELKKAREIVIKISVLPSAERDIGVVAVSCGSKLAPFVGEGTTILIEREGKRIVAREHLQGSLFESPKIHTLGKES